MSFLISAWHGRRAVWSLELQDIWCDCCFDWRGDEWGWTFECLEWGWYSLVRVYYKQCSIAFLCHQLRLSFCQSCLCDLLNRMSTLIEHQKTCKCLVNKHILDYGSLQNTSLFQWFAGRKQLKDIHFCFMSWFVGVQLYVNEQIFHAVKPVALYSFMSVMTHVVIVGNVYWQPTTGKHHKLKLFLSFLL